MLRKQRLRIVRKVVQKPTVQKQKRIVILFNKLFEKRKKTPVRVTFVCYHGAAVSPEHKRAFERLLEEKGVSRFFVVTAESEKLLSLYKPVKKTDYYVPVVPIEFSNGVKEVMAKKGVSLLRVSQKGHMGLLQDIIKQELLRS